MHESLQQKHHRERSGVKRALIVGNKNVSNRHLTTCRSSTVNAQLPFRWYMNSNHFIKTVMSSAILVITFVLGTFNAPAQAEGNGAMNPADTEKVIASFTSKEAEFRRALNSYSFKRDALVQSIGMGGQVVGEYHRVSTFTFDDQGNRYEKISFFPMSSMSEITQEDIDDLGGIEPFALEPSKISKYNIKYAGKEKIDELNLFIFDVAPKVMPDPKKTKERLFSGRIWVDDQDLQIVKTKGKGVPETKINKFPTVETYREHIDGRYWFPTYSYADEELIFDNGGYLYLRMKDCYSGVSPPRPPPKVTEGRETAKSRIGHTTTSPRGGPYNKTI